MSFRSKFLASTALTSFGFAWIVTPTLGADLKPVQAAASAPVALTEPAVSSFNWKIAGFGGWLDGDNGIRDYGSGLGGATGSITVPLSYSYGLQIDGIAGSWGGDSFYGTGGHLFWRDPRQGMLGVYGSWLRLDRGGWTFLNRGSGVEVATAMAEGEYYLGNITLRALAGWEGGDVQSRFTSRVDLAYYATPDFALSIGHRYAGGNNALALKAEWLTPVNVLAGGRASLFAEARIGEDEYRGVWGGLRVYFGQSRTLIDKHRRDDPVSDPNLDNLHSIASEVKKLDQANEAAKTSTSTVTIISDRRLKRDVVLLGRLDNGIGVYRYRYRWSDAVYVGVMAQEVARIVPDAVVPMDNGYLSVDYDRLGLRMLTWEAWSCGASIEAHPLAA